MNTVQCPYCDAVLPEDDLFCEECGQALRKEHAPLCVCGAPEGDLDDDGYCLQCGRRCRPAPGEYVETELSADFAAASNRGLRHHRNEDRVEIKDFGDRQVLVVCDGVSSSIDAQNAAAEAVATLVQKLSDGAELTDALKQAARAVAQLATESSEASPSTTVVAAVVAGRTVRIAWLGDSRAYWISPEGSRQLTTDHSWLNDVVSSGELSYAEAAESPSAHAITRWLGADADPDTEPGVTEFEVPGAGLLLLCTDGLWNYAHETDDIAALVLAKPSASALEIARDLVSFANEKGGQDNITVALLRFAQ